MRARLALEVQRILDAWEAGWRSSDLHLLESVWDSTYPHLVYIAEERAEPMLSWQAIEGYMAATFSVMEWVEVELTVVDADVSGEAASILCLTRWSGKNRRRAVPSGGTARVCFSLRRRGDAWKVVQYVEAPVNATYASTPDALETANDAFQRFAGGLKTGDWAPFLDVLTDDVRFRVPRGPFKGSNEGKAAAREFFSAVSQAFSEGRVIQADVVTSNRDTVVFECRDHGLLRGQPYENRVSLHFEIRGDKVCGFREYYGVER